MRLWLKCVQKSSLQKRWRNFMLDVWVHANSKKFGSNSSKLVISHSLGINPVFNVEDLILCHTPFDYLVVLSNLSFSTSPGLWPFPTRTPLQEHCLNEIEDFWIIRLLWLLMVDNVICCDGMDNRIHIALGYIARSSSLTWIYLRSITFIIY